MLQLRFRQRGRQRRLVEGEREQRNGETGNENEKDKKKRKWAPLNKKIIYSLQSVNSVVSNMRLHCLSIAKIISFKTFDGASFWVKNALKKKRRFLAFERFDKNTLYDGVLKFSICKRGVCILDIFKRFFSQILLFYLFLFLHIYIYIYFNICQNN